jgi:hypothetical protein
MGQGRFGPVFLADDVAGEQPVVVRVFERIDATVTEALLEALRLLCSSSLDHPAIARPIDCGTEGGFPFLVHTYLPGTPVDEFLTQHGPQPLDQVVIRVASVAASIDFAAAARVHHGVLGARDIILNEEGAGVTGFGLVQALSRVGIHVPGAAASHADDIYALAAIAFQLLSGVPYRGALDEPLAGVHRADSAALRAALASALAIDSEVRPASALDFARALQGAMPVANAVPATMPEPADRDGVDVGQTSMAGRLTLAPDLAADIPLRAAADDAPVTPEVERPRTTLSLKAPVDAPLFVPPAATSRKPVFLAVVAALLAAVAGFAGGFSVGQRSVSIGSSGQETQVAPAVSPQPQPEGTQGRTFTEAPIDERTSVSAESRPDENQPQPTSPAAPPAAAKPAPATPSTAVRSAPAPAAATADKPAATSERSAAAADTARGKPGSMDLLSRPSGAEVFVDGALVGRTPLSLADIEAGSHAVRISLPGHQRWVTSVEVRSGERTRVAASLELVTDPQ